MVVLQAARRRRAGRRPDLRGDPRASARPRTGSGKSDLRADARRARRGRCGARTQPPGYGPDTVELVEAHGTGTRAGDAAEIDGAAAGLRRDRAARTAQWCALGSVKSQIGHTKAAAGAAGPDQGGAGAAPQGAAADHQGRPARTRRSASRSSPFYLNTAGAAVDRAARTHPRRAAVSSFGFGGSELPRRAGGVRRGRCVSRVARPRVSEPPRASLSSLSATRPRTCARASPDGGHGRSAPTLAELAVESQRDFDHGRPCRLAVVAADAGDLREKLDRAAAMVAAARRAVRPSRWRLLRARRPPTRAGSRSSSPGRGRSTPGWAATSPWPSPRRSSVWDFAAASGCGGRALGDIVFPPPVFTDEQRAAQERQLTDTRWAQPALAAHSLSLLALLRVGRRRARLRGWATASASWSHCTPPARWTPRRLLRIGPAPRRAAGADRRRARHDARGRRRMRTPPRSAIGNRPSLACGSRTSTRPAQTVVSGTVRAIEALHGRLSAAGITARRLAVSAAFHSPLAGSAVGAAARISRRGVELTAPRIDVLRQRRRGGLPG